MRPEEAFLQAIVEAPDDDAPRLMYADWLEEHGDPRGEFIRTQIELAHLSEEDERFSALRALERRLYMAHSRQWFPGWKTRVRRGFVEGIWEVNQEELLPEVAEIFRIDPVQDLFLNVGKEGWGAELARYPYLSRLTTLRLSRSTSDDIQNPRITLSDLLALAASPHLTSLRALDIFGAVELTDEDFRELVGAGSRPFPQGLTRLARLSVGSSKLTDESVRILAHSPLARTLTHLHLFAQDATTERLRILIGSPLWLRLEELQLASLQDEDERAFSTLTSGLPQSRLRRLCLNRLSVGDANGEAVTTALAASETWGPLEALDLSNQKLSGSRLRTLLACPHLGGLNRLDLNGVHLKDEDVQAIAGCPYLGNLTHLMLGEGSFQGAPFGDDGLTALAHSPHLTRLGALDLSNTRNVTGAGIKALVSSPNASRLRVLRACVDDAALRAIAESPQLGRITSLYLSPARDRQLTEETIEALARSPHLPHLTTLRLDFDLTEKMMRTLLGARHFGWPGLNVAYRDLEDLRGYLDAARYYEDAYFFSFKYDDAPFFSWLT
jgi:uncharacterized protein (TIGR02996 family)